MSNVIKQESLSLSTSSINTFLNCPKKYFLQHLLGLKQDSSFSATYGLVLHAILEVFNATCLLSYSPKTLLNLSDIFLFNHQAALEAGFKQLHIDVIKETDSLSLKEIHLNIHQAIEQLHLNNFFHQIPQKVFVEVPFKFQLPQLPNVTFNGRIDAIYQYEDGFQVVDYKSGADKYKNLQYLISDHGVRFEGATGQHKGVFNENNVKNYQYQIPIYYLACQSLPQFKDKIKSIGLVYIRPKSKHNGFKTDFISPAEIQSKIPQILDNLQSTVIQKIRDTTSFEPNIDKFNCDYCSYQFLCEENDD